MKRLMLFMNISLLMSTYEYRHVKRSKLKHCFGSAFLTISFSPSSASLFIYSSNSCFLSLPSFQASVSYVILPGLSSPHQIAYAADWFHVLPPTCASQFNYAIRGHTLQKHLKQNTLCLRNS